MSEGNSWREVHHCTLGLEEFVCLKYKSLSPGVKSHNVFISHKKKNGQEINF